MPDEDVPTRTLVDTPASPELDEPGVAIAFAPNAPRSFEVGKPILLHGTCGAPERVLAQTRGQLLSGVLLAVVRRDRPGGWMAPVLATGRTRRAPGWDGGDEGEGEDDAQIEFAYFNIELGRFFKLPPEPAKYWVMAALSEWVSDRLSFEVVEAGEAP